MPRPLSECLAHTDEEVLRISGIKLNLAMPGAAALFIETRKFLWLQAQLRADMRAGVPELPRGIFVFEALRPIDEMWHQFILCTRSYSSFCESFLDGYLHHQPLSLVQHYGNEAEGPGGLRPVVRQELARQCHYIAQKLGADTLEYWYRGLVKDYPALRA
jgi:hypothetical protein